MKSRAFLLCRDASSPPAVWRVSRILLSRNTSGSVDCQLANHGRFKLNSCSLLVKHCTVWGGRLSKRFCNMFSGSSLAGLGNMAAVVQPNYLWNSKHVTKLFPQSAAPDRNYHLRTYLNFWPRTVCEGFERAAQLNMSTGPFLPSADVS